MNKTIKDRVLKEATYMRETKKTIREVASFYHISKSTVHKDLKERLVKIDQVLNNEVKAILNNHREIRHIRGGDATRKKYLSLKQ